ncbi:MAG: hypothetical protein ABR540_21075, partial [Acidimicrobiales bacterium]
MFRKGFSSLCQEPWIPAEPALPPSHERRARAPILAAAALGLTLGVISLASYSVVRGASST